MPEQNSYMLFYEVDVSTDNKASVKFSLDRFPIEMIPELVKQLNQHLFLEAARKGFYDERWHHANLANQTHDDWLAKQLQLFN